MKPMLTLTKNDLRARRASWLMAMLVGLWPLQSHAVAGAPVGNADNMSPEQAEQAMESVKEALCFLAKAGESAGGMSDALGGGGGGAGAGGAGQMLGSVAGMLSSMCQMTNLETGLGGDLGSGLGGLQDGLAGQLGEQLAGQVMQQAQQILQQKMQGGKKDQGAGSGGDEGGYDMSKTYSPGNKPTYNGMDYYQVGDGSTANESSLSPAAQEEFKTVARTSWNTYAQQLADSGVPEAVVLLRGGAGASQSGGVSIGNGATTGNAGVSIGGAAGSGGSAANQKLTAPQATALMKTRQQNFLRGFARARAGLAQESALTTNADYRQGYAAGAASLRPTRT